MKVVVVGAGFAGLAAAFAARRAGATVTVVQHGSGASALYAGAVDGPLDLAPGVSAALLPELTRALGLRLKPGTVVASREGVIRPASGADNSLLDLGALAGKRIGVVDVPRDDWDGPLLARAFAESDWARSTGTRFELVPLDLLEKGHQRRISSFDYAASFERAERPAWLEQLLKQHAGPEAWLFGPWLGVKRELGKQLSAFVGVPVGEVTSPPGGVAGARFEARRDELLRALEVELVSQPVSRITPGEVVSFQLADGNRRVCDALVVATGGIVSGAIELNAVLSGAEPAGFELAVAGLPPLQIRGEPAGSVSSLFGVDLAARGRRLLERVGLPVGANGAVLGAPRIYAAGDASGPEIPGVGPALSSGLLAGTAAASHN